LKRPGEIAAALCAEPPREAISLAVTPLQVSKSTHVATKVADFFAPGERGDVRPVRLDTDSETGGVGILNPVADHSVQYEGIPLSHVRRAHLSRNPTTGELEWVRGEARGRLPKVIHGTLLHPFAAADAIDAIHAGSFKDEDGNLHESHVASASPTGIVSRPASSDERFSGADISSVRTNGLLEIHGLPLFHGILAGSNAHDTTGVGAENSYYDEWVKQVQATNPGQLSGEALLGRHGRSLYATPPVVAFERPLNREISRLRQRLAFLQSKTTKLTAEGRMEMRSLEEELRSKEQLMQKIRIPDSASAMADDSDLGQSFFGIAPTLRGGMAPMYGKPSNPLRIEDLTRTVSATGGDRPYLTRGMGLFVDPSKHAGHYAQVVRAMTVPTVGVGGGLRSPNRPFSVIPTRVRVHTSVEPNTRMIPGLPNIPLRNVAALYPTIRGLVQGQVFFSDEDGVPTYVTAADNGPVLYNPRAETRASLVADGLPMYEHWGYAYTKSGTGHTLELTRLQDLKARSEIDPAVKFTDSDRQKLVKLQEEVDVRRKASDLFGYNSDTRPKIPGVPNQYGHPTIGEGPIARRAIPGLDPNAEVSKTRAVFDPLQIGTADRPSYISLSMIPAQSLDNISNTRESPYLRVLHDHDGVPDEVVRIPDRGTTTKRLSPDELTSEELAKKSFRAVVSSVGTSRYRVAMLLPSTAKHPVISTYNVRYSPQTMSYRAPAGAPNLLGQILGSVSEENNRRISQNVDQARIFEELFAARDSDTGRIFQQVIDSSNNPFAMHANLPLFEPVWDAEGNPIPGAYRQSLQASYVSRPLPGISAAEAARAGLQPIYQPPEGNIPPILLDDPYSPMSPDGTRSARGLAVYRLNSDTENGMQLLFPQNANAYFGVYDGQLRPESRRETYTYVNDTIRAAPVRQSKEGSDSTIDKHAAIELSRRLYYRRRNSAELASGQYKIIPVFEHDTQPSKKSNALMMRGWQSELMDGVSSHLETVENPSKEYVENYIIDSFAADPFANSEDKRSSISDDQARAMFNALGVFQMSQPEQFSLQEFKNWMREGLKKGKTDKEIIENRPVIGDAVFWPQDPAPPQVTTPRKKIVGAYRLFSQSRPLSLGECSISEDGRLMIPFKSPDFDQIREGQSLQLYSYNDGTKDVRYQYTPDQLTKRLLDPLLITEVMYDKRSKMAFCRTSQPIASYFGTDPDAIRKLESDLTKSFSITLHRHELHPVLPSDFVPYDGYIEQTDEPIPPDLFMKMLMGNELRDAEKEVAKNILRYFHAAATKRELGNDSEGLLRKIGVPVDAQDSHYMFASLKPEHYTWARFAADTTVDLNSPQYSEVMQLIKSMGKDTVDEISDPQQRIKIFEAIKEVAQNPEKQEKGIAEWLKQPLGQAILNFRNNRKPDADPMVQVKGDEGQLLSRTIGSLRWDPRDKQIQTGGEPITVAQHIFRMLGGGGQSAEQKTVLNGDRYSYTTEQGQQRQLSINGLVNTGNSLLLQEYKGCINDEFLKVIGFGAMADFAANLDDFDKNHSSLEYLDPTKEATGNPFDAIRKKLSLFALSDDNQEKIRLAGQIQKICDSYRNQQLRLVHERIGYYEELRDPQKAMFTALANEGIVGNFDRLQDVLSLIPGMKPQESKIIGFLGESDDFGNRMPGNSGFYRSSSNSNAYECSEAYLNPSAFQIVAGAGQNQDDEDLTFAKALEYPVIRKEVQQVARIGMELLFDPEGVGDAWEKLDEQDKSLLWTHLGLETDPSNLLKGIANYLGIDENDIRAGMMEQIKSSVTNLMSAEIANSASLTALHIQREQEKLRDSAYEAAKTKTAPRIDPPAPLVRRWSPLTNVVPHFRAYAEYGMEKTDRFEGRLPEVVAATLHPDNSFVPPMAPYSDEHELMDIPYGEGVLRGQSPFPACSDTMLQNVMRLKQDARAASRIIYWDNPAKSNDIVTVDQFDGAMFGNSFSSRWAPLRMLGQDSSDDSVSDGAVASITKQYFGIDQEDDAQTVALKIQNAILQGNALNGLLLAADVADQVDVEETVELPGHTRENPKTKNERGTGRVHRIDGIAGQLGRSKAQNGIYAVVDKSPDALKFERTGNSITIQKGLSFSWVSKGQSKIPGQIFSAQKVITDVPITISWSVQSNRININLSDLRKKTEIVSRIIDSDLTPTEEKNAQASAREHATRESNARLFSGAMPQEIPSLSSHDPRVKSAFQSQFDSSLVGTGNGFESVQNAREFELSTGWSLLHEDAIRDAFKDQRFEALIAPHASGQQGIVVATLPQQEDDEKVHAIVFIPMIPAGDTSALHDHTDHIDREGALIEERLYHQARESSYVLGLHSGSLDASSGNPGQTAAERMSRAPNFVNGSRSPLRNGKPDNIRVGRPLENETERMARTKRGGDGTPRSTPSVYGRFVVVSLDTNDFQKRDLAGSYVSFGDVDNKKAKSIEELKIKLQEARKKAKEAGIETVSNVNKRVELMTPTEKLMHAINMLEKEIRTAQLGLSEKQRKINESAEDIVVVPRESITSYWDPTIIMNHSSVAKMTPYLAYWLSQKSKRLDFSDSMKETYDHIQEHPLIDDSAKAALRDGIFSSIEERDRNTDSASANDKLLAKDHVHSRLITIPDGDSKISFLEIPDRVLKIDPTLSDRKIRFSSQQIATFLEELPSQLKKIAAENGLTVWAINGKVSEAFNYTNRAGQPLDAYGYRKKNVIIASTIGVDPMMEFITHFADFIAEKTWLVQDEMQMGQLNSVNKNYGECYTKALDWAKTKIDQAKKIRDSGFRENPDDPMSEELPREKRWIFNEILANISDQDELQDQLKVAKKLFQIYIATLLFSSGSFAESKSGKTHTYVNMPPVGWLNGAMPPPHFVSFDPVEQATALVHKNVRWEQLLNDTNDESKGIKDDAAALSTAVSDYVLSLSKTVAPEEKHINIAKLKINANTDAEQKESITYGIQPVNPSWGAELRTLEQQLKQQTGLTEQEKEQERAKISKLKKTIADAKNTGALAIIASAGTGKTTTITQRIANIVAANIASPSQFFIASFTRESADDLLERLNKVFQDGTTKDNLFSKSQVNTWHGMMMNLLTSPIKWQIPEGLLSLGKVFDTEVIPLRFFMKEEFVPAQGDAPAYIKQSGPAFTNAKSVVIMDSDEKSDEATRLAIMELRKQACQEAGVPLGVGRDDPEQFGKHKDSFDVGNLDNMENIFKQIEKIKSFGYTPAQLELAFEQRRIARMSDSSIPPISKEDLDLLAVYKKHQQLMQQRHWMDHTDVLNAAYSVLSNDRKLLSIYQRKFRQFFVDEFQDQNGVQSKLLELLAHKKNGGSGNVTVVGDANQAIFSWRGSSSDFLNNFDREYGGVKKTISTNYRSTQNIIETANRLQLVNNTESRAKMKPRPNAPVGDPVHLIKCDTQDDQINFIANQILQLIGKSRQEDAVIPTGEMMFNKKDIMIICRTNREARSITAQLNAKGIDAAEVQRQHVRRLDREEDDRSVFDLGSRDTGRKVARLARSRRETGSQHLFEVVDALALANDYNQKHDVDYPKKWTNKALSIMSTISQILQKNNAGIKKGVFYKDLIEAYADHLETRSQDSLFRFLMKSTSVAAGNLRDRLTKKQLSILQSVQSIAEQAARKKTTTAEGYLEAMFGSPTFFQKKLMAIAKSSKNNKAYKLNEVREFLVELGILGGDGTQQMRALSSIPKILRIQADRARAEAEAFNSTQANQVRVITIHKAKGMEAPVVFLPSWSSGNMPLEQSKTGGAIPRAEEANLGYVALTRAKSLAYVSYAAKSGSGREQEISPFASLFPKTSSKIWGFDGSSLSVTRDTTGSRATSSAGPSRELSYAGYGSSGGIDRQEHAAQLLTLLALLQGRSLIRSSYAPLGVTPWGRPTFTEKGTIASARGHLFNPESEQAPAAATPPSRVRHDPDADSDIDLDNEPDFDVSAFDSLERSLRFPNVSSFFKANQLKKSFFREQPIPRVPFRGKILV
jgi:superfamily I DNA/RNA helicase